MIYTAWGVNGVPDTFIAGREPPKFANGTFEYDQSNFIWEVEAENWTEACKAYHKYRGWEPYIPMD